MNADAATTTDSAGDVGQTRPAGGPLAAFFCGLTSAAAMTAGIALLLYTGQGFLKTAGILLGIAIGALTAGVWAGDESSKSTRPRVTILVIALLAAAVFAVKWSISDTLRAAPVGGSFAVLFILAIPAYACGGAIAGITRHSTSKNVAVEMLAGVAIGCVLATTILIPQLDAWGVYFTAAALLMPSVLLPMTSTEESRRERAGALQQQGGAMRDKVVIVTGVGSAGQLGYAIARKFVDAGARVVIAGLTDDVRTLASQLGARERVAGVRADLTTDAGVSAVVEAARTFGRLDALVNVAGGLTVIDTIADTTPEKFQREMRINAETVLRMSRAALPLLRDSRGAIVNFASPAGEHATVKLGAYSAAKAAVIAITRSLALEELQNGVRVNAIAPGMIDTEQNRASAAADAKYVTREEVADAVMFLVTEPSRGISGEVIHAAGATLQ